MSTFMVLWCLYEENVWALASKFDGYKHLKTINNHSDFLSESILKIVQIGIVFHSCSLSGQKTRVDNLASITTIQDEKILETVVKDMLNRYAKS